MYRSAAFRFEHRSPVRAGRPAALHVVLRASRGDGREPRADAADRRALPEVAVLWQPQDCRGTGHQPQAGAAADAAYGLAGDLPEAAYDVASGRTPDLPVFAAGYRGFSARPGVGHRHHVRTDASWVFVPGGDHGLVQPVRAVLAAVEHAGRGVLSGGLGRGAEPRSAGDFQQRPGQSIHGRRSPSGFGRAEWRSA